MSGATPAAPVRAPHARVPTPRALAPFAALAGVVTLAGAAGVLPRWPGLVHAVGLPPLDLYADLRVLLVHATSPLWFALGAVASLAVRVTVLALVLAAAGAGRAVRLAATFYGAALVPAFVAAWLAWGSAATLFYALVWAGLLAALLLVALTGAWPWAAVAGAGRPWRSAARAGFRLGTIGAYLAALGVLGALADWGGGAAAVALVPLSGVLTVAAVWLLLEPDRLRLPRRIAAGLVAAALAGAVVVVMTGPAAPTPVGEDGAEAAPAREGSLLLMSGVDSRTGRGAIFEVDPRRLGYECDQTHYYSYRGPGEGGPQGDAFCPVRTGAPYGPDDTYRSRDELVPWFVEQVRALEPPVTVLAHSQAVWVAWEALQDGAHGVEHLVLVGPFTTHHAPFPVPGERGPGAAGAMLMWIPEAVPRPGGTTSFDAEAPLAREYLGHPDRVDELMARPVAPGVRALAVPSLFDLPLLPDSAHIDHAERACPVPVVHPNLPYADELAEAVVRFLEGEPAARCPLGRRPVGSLLRPWATPPHR